MLGLTPPGPSLEPAWEVGPTWGLVQVGVAAVSTQKARFKNKNVL